MVYGVPVAAVSHAGLDGYTARLGRLTIARRRRPPSRRRRPRSSRNEHRATRCGLRGPVENQLGHAIDETLERLHGSVPGVYTLYNVMPSESDANAAASSFARRMFGSDACDRLLSDDWAVLIQQQPPPAIDDVGLRQVCFAAVHAEALKQSPRLGPAGIKPLLDALAPDIAERWIDIARDTRLQALARAALDSSPSWEPATSLTLAAYRRACALAASEA